MEGGVLFDAYVAQAKRPARLHLPRVDRLEATSHDFGNVGPAVEPED